MKSGMSISSHSTLLPQWLKFHSGISSFAPVLLCPGLKFSENTDALPCQKLWNGSFLWQNFLLKGTDLVKFLTLHLIKYYLVMGAYLNHTIWSSNLFPLIILNLSPFLLSSSNILYIWLTHCGYFVTLKECKYYSSKYFSFVFFMI